MANRTKAAAAAKNRRKSQKNIAATRLDRAAAMAKALAQYPGPNLVRGPGLPNESLRPIVAVAGLALGPSKDIHHRPNKVPAADRRIIR